ncbi:hypothetical protein ERO13_A05G388350v2 [Gossypium hirsutum]|nr:hypothetical protein ERO13_A05G388350v2 [Gossypium hirsutum]
MEGLLQAGSSYFYYNPRSLLPDWSPSTASSVAPATVHGGRRSKKVQVGRCHSGGACRHRWWMGQGGNS